MSEEEARRRAWDDESQHIADLTTFLLEQVRRRSGSIMARQLLSHICHKIDDVCPRYVSDAAQEKAKTLGIESDLREFDWHDQRRRMRDPHRSVFLWEHVVPRSQLRDMLLALPEAQPKKVFSIVRRARIAWILRSEDEELTKRGFRSHRTNPYQCYETAGIQLLHVERADREAWSLL